MTAADKLLSARMKLKRAKQHIKDFDLAIRNFRRRNPCKLASKKDRANSDRMLLYVASLRAVPERFPLIAGDILFNLRSALDHVALQLWLASPSRKGTERRVYFPISTSAANFSDALETHIKGARTDIAKAVAAIEPYQGGKGHQFWVLNELNNADKHRLLLTVAMGRRMLNMGDIIRAMAPPKVRKGFEAVGDLYFTPEGPVKVAPNVLYAINRGDEIFGYSSKSKIYKKVNLPFEIAFDEPQVGEGDSAVKTLQGFSQLVAKVIDDFARLL